jgi:hypothetical protein
MTGNKLAPCWWLKTPSGGPMLVASDNVAPRSCAGVVGMNEVTATTHGVGSDAASCG